MAWLVMAYMVMAYEVMAYVVVAYVVMAIGKQRQAYIMSGPFHAAGRRRKSPPVKVVTLY